MSDIAPITEARAHVSILQVVADSLAARLPLLDSCGRLMRATCQALHWDFAAVWVPDESQTLRCAFTFAAQPGALTALAEETMKLRLPIGAELAGQAWEHQSPTWLTSLASETSVARWRLAHAEGLRTGFAFPLGADDEVSAVVEFFSRSKRSRDDTLLQLLATAGKQFGAQALMDRTRRAVESQRLNANEATVQLETGFKQVLDAMTDIVIVKSPGSRIVWANKAMRDLYGMSIDDLAGMIDAPFNEPDITQAYVRDDALVFSSGIALDIPDEAVTRFDGEVRRVHTTKSPIFDAAGNVVLLVIVCHDITDSKRMEEELRLTARLASIGTLAAGVAHEINTPVQFINDSIHFLRDASLDVARLMRRLQTLRGLHLERAPAEALRVAEQNVAIVEGATDMPYLTEHVPKAFERCLDGLARVSTIVRSLKAFSHPVQREMAPTDLNLAIETTVVVAQGEYKYVAAIARDLAALPPVTCNVDDINQVVLNLLVNASQAIAAVVQNSGEKGTITISTRVVGEDVIIAIGDTGCGIPDDIRGRVFEPFFTTKDVGQGTGQGLALAWSIVTAKHGGQLTFESVVGVGTTFFIRLPIEGRANTSAPALAA